MTASVRLDKWLWFARFLKSRSLATTLVGKGHLRVNGQLMAKAHYLVKVGDVLTFPLGPHIRVIKVLAPGARRGPAPEAQLLYEDLEPPVAQRRREFPEAGEPPHRTPGSGRPTKRERRATDDLIGKEHIDDE